MELARKFEPLMVSEKPLLPTIAVAGLNVIAPGAGLLMGKLTAFDVPPPGAGLTTAIVAVPVLAMSAAVTSIVKVVAETNVVARSAPLNLTCELLRKLLPLIARVKVELPTMTDAGVNVVIVGIGLPTIKFNSSEVPPPGVGVSTESFRIVAFVRSAAVSVICNCVTDTKLVVRSAPLTLTMEFGLK